MFNPQGEGAVRPRRFPPWAINSAHRLQEHPLWTTHFAGWFGVCQFSRIRCVLATRWLVIASVKSLLHLYHQYSHVVITSIQDDA